MIKTFEQFVNEMYSQQRDNGYDREMVDYLSTLGVSDEDCREIYIIAKKSRILYTPEDIENILKRLPGCDSVEGIVDFIKTVLYSKKKIVSVRDGGELEPGLYKEGSVKNIDKLYDWIEEHGGDVNKCPVVRGITGKLLTGNVLYVVQFDAYGEDFEDFAEITSEYGTRNGVLDDDLPDYDFFEDAIEGVDFYEVDLDKECGWTEK
jgi:hypothetical protein